MKILLVVFVGFVCCWFLIGVMDNIDVVCGEYILLWRVYIIYVFLLYLSSVINFFIYVVMSK